MNSRNVFIAQPTSEEQFTALKSVLKALKIQFEIRKQDEVYNPEFVNMVLEAEKEIKSGKGKKLSSEEFNDIWK